VIEAGYFVKQIAPKPEAMPVPGVREICSVSECISPGPEGWVEHWRHNQFGWYNRVADALDVVPADQRSNYRVFAYRLYPEMFRKGRRIPVAVPEDVRPEPVPSNFRTLGFDAVSKTPETVLSFECSPLSCNGMASEMEVNEYCLFPDLDAALRGAERFSREEGVEPGDYYVVEVLEQS
jgi:hypothetical protein